MSSAATSGGATAAAAAAAIANATKASGAIVSMDPESFVKILNKVESPLVVVAKAGFMNKKLRYLTSYRGLFFTTLSRGPIQHPSRTEFITADKIWIPG